jgi:DNA-binding NarL/FixJ family response regulator
VSRATLTPAVLDVLAGAARGETATDTARRRVVSVHTVKTQRLRALEATGSRTMPEAVHKATRAGLLP